MKIFELQKSQVIPVSIQEAWEFFSSPQNLPEITPPHMGFKIVNQVPNGIYAGMIIQYKVKPLPLVSVNWVTEITQIDNLRYFIDEQRFGPYAFWHHQHHFRQVEEGTEVVDLVHYALPLRFLGRFAHWLFVKHRLNAIFEFRRRALIDRFGLPQNTTQIQTA